MAIAYVEPITVESLSAELSLVEADLDVLRRRVKKLRADLDALTAP
jgi:uncharacterized protein YigA (DUF484 family)